MGYSANLKLGAILSHRGGFMKKFLRVLWLDILPITFMVIAYTLVASL
jgi:hypothetical protein